MRSFVAIELQEKLRASLGKLVAELRSCGADVKWVRPEGIHLTLRFLGEIDPAQVELIHLALGEVVSAHEPFVLTAKGLGCFPSMEQARVVWVGLDGETWRLSTLQREVEKALVELGFPRENRPFRPHLTLGRVRSPRARHALVSRIRSMERVDLGELQVHAVAQFKSELLPGGARYSLLWKESLGMSSKV